MHGQWLRQGIPPLADAYVESFDSRFWDWFLNAELFASLSEPMVLVVRCRTECNVLGPHSHL